MCIMSAHNKHYYLLLYVLSQTEMKSLYISAEMLWKYAMKTMVWGGRKWVTLFSASHNNAERRERERDRVERSLFAR